MLSYIEGTIKQVYADSILVVTHGLGYRIMPCKPPFSYKEGQEMTLLLRSFIKEDHIEMYGFGDDKEVTYFEYLTEVTGVGPKSAINILRVLSLDDIEKAARTGDVGMFQKVPGIGKKVASRLVLELQSKFQNEVSLHALSSNNASPELIKALRSLGYSQQEAIAMVHDVPKNLTLEEQLQYTLKSYG